MTSSTGVPEVSPEQRQDEEIVDGLMRVITDRHCGAQALNRLLATAYKPLRDGDQIFVRLDADAWYAAIAWDCAPRPSLPRVPAEVVSNG